MNYILIEDKIYIQIKSHQTNNRTVHPRPETKRPEKSTAPLAVVQNHGATDRTVDRFDPHSAYTRADTRSSFFRHRKRKSTQRHAAAAKRERFPHHDAQVRAENGFCYNWKVPPRSRIRASEPPDDFESEIFLTDSGRDEEKEKKRFALTLGVAKISLAVGKKNWLVE